MNVTESTRHPLKRKEAPSEEHDQAHKKVCTSVDKQRAVLEELVAHLANQEFSTLFIKATTYILDGNYKDLDELCVKYQVIAQLGEGDFSRASQTLRIKLLLFPSSEILSSLKQEMIEKNLFVEAPDFNGSTFWLSQFPKDWGSIFLMY